VTKPRDTYTFESFHNLETTDMELSEVISAAASIAGHLARRPFETGDASPDRINQIAKVAVQIVRQIEEEARKSYD